MSPRPSAFDFFDRIFCINLERRPERWAVAQREFASAGILERVQRFSAIECADGAEGCLQSHLACVRLAESSGAENALIFEDDVQFPGPVETRLEAALATLKGEPWDIFYLGAQVLSRATRVGPDLISAPMYQTHAYAVHRRAFDRISSATSPIDVWYKNHLRSYAARTPLAVQRTVESDIVGGLADRDVRRSYELFVEATPTEYVAKRIYYSVRRALGRTLVRIAQPLGVPLTFVDGRPRLGRGPEAS